MRSSGKWLWRLVGLISLASFILLASGFVFALDPRQLAAEDTHRPVESKKPSDRAPAEGIQQIVALGDSLTRGVGDTSGLGYIGRVRQALEKKTGHTITLSNLAINGQESPSLVLQVSQEQVKRQLAASDLIFITIGGNDLFKQSGELVDIDVKKLTEAAERLTVNFEEIVKQIRSVNSQAIIIYASLYNPFGDTEAASDTIQPVLDWNSAASTIAARYPNVIVVPTYDLFVKKEQTYLYTDHFHPNTDGYARMAERILQALE
ncbi:GDSL-type esterase/lipase family protein [Brevibacillus ruminantium]|uniref:GDSL-type esterase/lipase family protein n=1 Tax=Brevibacillus ruminantium TaxID=2950604 RepID=A0ABY4WJT4_9BACL|nr:GDSL-type esterase/lipase family protein [Brevibacillus ruminantium]USG67293.1 GDSL-type esterase/lipase family protein [Brevibacillus ruminantium]